MGPAIGGLGGGVLTVSALVYVLGWSAQDATAASVVVVGITAAAGFLARVCTGGIDWRTGLMFGAVRIPTGFLGTACSTTGSVGRPSARLTLIAAAAMLLNAGYPTSDRATGQDTFPDHAEVGAAVTGTATSCR